MTEPLTLQELLIGYGPYSDGEAPTDAEMFGRLDQFGEAVWRIESRTQREYAAQTWADYLANNIVPAPLKPWRIVQEAMAVGNVATERGWRWYSDTELAELPPTADLVSGHITESSLVLLYGPSGHGKTLIALDLALSVATGTPWHGHDVQQGPVAYIIAEGIGGLALRVQAWREEHQWTDPIPIKFLPHPVELLEPSEAARLVTELQAWDPAPKLVEVDTLAWCLSPGGNENSPEDMGAYVRAIGHLRTATGATVLTVHHTGHDTSRERGHTSLKAAMDTVLRAKMADDVITVGCDKQREAAPFKSLHFELKEVGQSVVLVPTDVSGTNVGLTKNDQRVLEALHSIELDEGVPTSKWDQTTGIPHGSFYRSQKQLVLNGYVRKEKRRYFITDSGLQAISPKEVPF